MSRTAQSVIRKPSTRASGPRDGLDDQDCVAQFDDVTYRLEVDIDRPDTGVECEDTGSARGRSCSASRFTLPGRPPRLG